MYISKNGYRVVYAPKHQKMNRKKKGDVYEHRLVWEVYHNCCLLPWAHIHHKNGNKLCNHIENFEPIFKSEHSRQHWMGNQYSKKDMTGRCCSICSSTTTYVKPDGWPQWFNLPDGGHMCRRCHDKLRKRKKN